MSTTPMTIRATDPITGDWLFGSGRQSYRTGDAAIAQDVRSAINCFLNDAFWNQTFGIDWINYLGTKGTENAIILAVRRMISTRQGITAVNTISATVNPTDRKLTLAYKATTIFSATILDAVAVEIPIGT